MITKSWRTDKTRHAQQERDFEAGQLITRGWKVDTFDAELMGRNGFTVYGFEAYRLSGSVS